MPSLAERVLAHVRRHDLLRAGDRVGVAVSGGADSVALLRLLLELRGELGVVLSAVHFNHKLRGAESDADEGFVAGLAREHDLEFICDSDDVAGHATEQKVSLEVAARDLRYGFFRHLLGAECTSGAKAPLPFAPLDCSAESAAPPGTASLVLKPTSEQAPSRGAEAPLFHQLNRIVTGHTLDDQAETVLMRLIRGAGLKGLGGIHPRIVVENDDGDVCGEILRPLLAFRRSELRVYLEEVGQNWREDATNTDESFTRNRVRRLLVPLVEKEFNPAVAENLSELSEIARGEEDYWENEITGWMGTGVHWLRPEWARGKSNADLVQIKGLEKIPTLTAENAARMGHPSVPESNYDLERISQAPWLVMNASIDRLWFLGEPVAVQRRVVKAIGEEAGIPLEFKHVEEILRFAMAEETAGKALTLPLGWRLEVHPGEVLFVTPDLRDPALPQDYEYALPVPGRVAVPEGEFVIEVQRIPGAAVAEYNPDQLLNADSVTGSLVVRNWRAGDRFWPAHTKSPKKIKELLQERQVAQAERRLWPVVVSGDEIIWMRGFPVPAKLGAIGEAAAILIKERPMVEAVGTASV